MTHGWAYVVPRAVIVLIGWGATYFILTALSTHLPPSVIYLTGILWMLAGVICFGYLYKLRRDMELLPRRPAAAPPQSTTPALTAPEPTVVARLRAVPPRRRTAA